MGSKIQAPLPEEPKLGEQRGSGDLHRQESSNDIAAWTVSPLTWLSLGCLDAPIVAVSWQWLFANSLHVHISQAERIALFLTAWFIYLADRVADSFTIRPRRPISVRQRFCLEHRSLMIFLLTLIAIADASVALHALDRHTLVSGAIIGAAIGLYLIVNHLASFVWRMVPFKEVSIGFLFAMGTVTAFHLSGLVFLTATFLFASLCSLNCLSISVWEQSLDLSQGRVSFATTHPRWLRAPQIGSSLLALTGLLLAINHGFRQFAFCISSSAVLLVMLNHAAFLSRDECVALADLVLLTPVAFCSGGL
jgi:hypothetical protein